MLRLIILLCFVGSLYALSCPCWKWSEEDKELFCPDVSECPVGITHDACGCCEKCAQNEGEKCGGPWYTSGRCGTGLKCKDLAEDTHIASLPISICVKDD